MFEVQQTTDVLTMLMSAEVASIDRADTAFSDWLSAGDIPVDVFQTRLLLRESLLNAVVHGGGKDASKQVTFEARRCPKMLQITVRDPGAGFAWPEGDPHFDILGDGGRGIPLMQIYSDEMAFQGTGNELVLKKKFTEATSSPRSIPSPQGVPE